VHEHFSEDQALELTWDVMRNAANKIMVSLGVDAPLVTDGTELFSVDEDGRRVLLMIADGGEGVSDADRARLFTRFERGGEAAPDGGSGLGLPIVKAAVAHNRTKTRPVKTGRAKARPAARG